MAIKSKNTSDEYIIDDALILHYNIQQLNNIIMFLDFIADLYLRKCYTLI